MIDRIYSFLGLAMKAGRLVSGEEACEKAAKQGKAELVIIAQDASPNTKKKFSDKCDFRDINTRIFGHKELIGRYIGKEERAVVAILDKGFAKRMVEFIDRKDSEFGGERNGKIQGL